MAAASDDRSELLRAVARAGVPTNDQFADPDFDVEDEVATPLQLLVASGLELLFEFSVKYMTLAPIYSVTQPLAVLKTRTLFRQIQSVPAPRFQEVDEEGNSVAATPAALPAVSWRRIRADEGPSALWAGWNARCLHQALWRGGTISTAEILFYFGGNSWAGLAAKSIFSLVSWSFIAHPLDVVKHRAMAGMAGYTSGVYWGLMRALKDDTAYAGLRTSMALALLQAPVRFGFLSLPASLLLVSLLYPLDARATLAQLREDEPGAAPRTARREGGVLALYLEPAFRHYFSSNALELISAAIGGAFLDALIEALEQQARAQRA